MSDKNKKKHSLVLREARRLFLWVATCSLIVGLFFGAIAILMDGRADFLNRIQSMLIVLAIALFLSTNNLFRIEKGGKVVQGFGLVGFASNVIWLFVSWLLIMGICAPIQIGDNSGYGSSRTLSVELEDYGERDYYEEDDYDDDYDEDYNEDEDYYYDYDDYDYDYDYSLNGVDDFDATSFFDDTSSFGSNGLINAFFSVIKLTVATKIVIVFFSISLACFWISNILSMKRIFGVVKPLVIVAISCELCCCFFVILCVLSDYPYSDGLTRWILLATFAKFGFWLSLIAAWVISRFSLDLWSGTEKTATGNDSGLGERIEIKVVGAKTDENDSDDLDI